MAYIGLPLGESYPSAEKQSVYLAAPADWAIYIYIYIYIYTLFTTEFYVCLKTVYCSSQGERKDANVIIFPFLFGGGAVVALGVLGFYFFF